MFIASSLKFVKKNNSLHLVWASSLLVAFRMLIGAIHPIYLLSTGVELYEIALLEIVSTVTMLVGEIPTGIFADKIGRKVSVVSSCIFFCLFYVLCLQSPDFFMLSLAEFFYGIGLCLINGASTGWLSSSISNEFYNKNKLNEYLHLQHEISALGCAICGSFAAIMVGVLGGQYKTIYMISGGSMLFLLLYFLVISYQHTNHQSTKDTFDYTKILHKNFLSSIISRKFVFYTGVLIALGLAFQPMAHYWQPFFVEFLDRHSYTASTISNESFLLGVIFFSYCMMKYFVHKAIKQYFAKDRQASTLQIMTALAIGCAIFSVLLSSNISLIFCIVLFSMLHGAHSAVSVISEGEYVRHISEDRIATMLSTATFFSRVLNVVFLGCIAIFVKNYPIKYLFSFNAIWFIIIPLIILFYKKRNVL